MGPFSRNAAQNDEQMQLNSNTFDKMTKYEKFMDQGNNSGTPIETRMLKNNTSSKNTAYDHSNTGRANTNMRP